MYIVAGDNLYMLDDNICRNSPTLPRENINCRLFTVTYKLQRAFQE